MGNLCGKDLPNINLSCANNNANNSCCKWISFNSEESKYLYKWVYNIQNGGYSQMKESNKLYSNFYRCHMSAINKILPLKQDDVVELFIFKCDRRTKRIDSLMYQNRLGHVTK